MNPSQEVDIITDRKEIIALAGLDLYQSELEEKLDLYKNQDIKRRRNWTAKDLDIYIKKVVSTLIVENAFRTNTRGKAKIKSDKEVILDISEKLNIEIMAAKHIFTEVKSQLNLGTGKEDAKDYLTAQIYAKLDALDLEIVASETEKDRQRWYEIKMKAMEQLAKIENLEEKQNVNNTTVHGSVNSQTNIDKQIVLSESDVMFKLMNQLLPKRS